MLISSNQFSSNTTTTPINISQWLNNAQKQIQEEKKKMN